MCFTLVSVLVVNATIASAALAVDLFTSDSPSSTTITGNQAPKLNFIIIGQPIECEVVHFEGTMGNSAEGVVLTPDLETCTYDKTKAILQMNGCQFRIASETNASGHSIFQILNCPTAAPILLNISIKEQPCKLTVIEQTAVEGAKFTNETTGAKKTLLMHVTAKFKIHLSEGTYFLCKALSGTNFMYNGSVTLTGVNDNPEHAPVNITVDEAPDA